MTFSHTSVLLYETVDSLNISLTAFMWTALSEEEAMPLWC